MLCNRLGIAILCTFSQIIQLIYGETVVDVFFKGALWGGPLIDDMKTLLQDEMFTVDVQDITQQTALQVSASSGQSEVVSWLIDQGADLDASGGGSTPLMHAARRGHTSIVRLLIDNGADASLQHKISGWTALHLASMRKDKDLAHMLLEYDPSVCDLKDQKGRTPFELAKSKKEDNLVVQLLLTLCVSKKDLLL